MAGMGVEDLRAVDSIFKYRGIAVAVRVGVDDQYLVVEFPVELPGAHAAQIWVRPQPRLVNAIDQIVVVVLREAQLRPQDSGLPSPSSSPRALEAGWPARSWWIALVPSYGA